QNPTVIQLSQESAFLAYELEPLKPYILEMDPRLTLPRDLRLKITKLIPSKKRSKQEWLLEAVYASDMGSVDLFAIWDAFQERRKHLFSEAGLLYLKEP